MGSRIDILGIGFDDVTIDQAVLKACDVISRREKNYVATPNPEIVWMCRKNEQLRFAVNNAGIVISDGIGIILGARILGTPLRGGRIPGIEFATALFEKIAEFGGSVFLLGAKPSVAEEAGNKLAANYPGLVIAGTADGYFEETESVISKINNACPDFLIVCLGSPKQELWIVENLEKINVALCAGLGGVLDVFAGNVKRAPAAFRRLGLEWLYRLICQPSRIKRMIKIPLFVFAVIWRRLRMK